MAFGKFGRYHPGGVDARFEAVDVAALVRREVEAEGRGLVDIDAPAGGATIESDPMHIQYVVVNLVHNAVKYSDGKRVRVAVREVTDGVELTVADDGIGIPQAEVDKLFSPFFRASNVAARPGTGMGLAIVKKSANLVGARIAVDSQVARGTTFRVVFPRTRS